MLSLRNLSRSVSFAALCPPTLETHALRRGLHSFRFAAGFLHNICDVNRDAKYGLSADDPRTLERLKPRPFQTRRHATASFARRLK